jgi:hypothetical protein
MKKKSFRYSSQTKKTVSELCKNLKLWSSDSCKEGLFLEIANLISDLKVSVETDQSLYTDNYSEYFEQYAKQYYNQINYNEN